MLLVRVGPYKGRGMDDLTSDCKTSPREGRFEKVRRSIVVIVCFLRVETNRRCARGMHARVLSVFGTICVCALFLCVSVVSIILTSTS